MLDTLGIDQLWVSKHQLSSVSGCEVRFLAEEAAGFDGWTVPKARGSVAHRAIELSMHARGEPVPGELVDDALARMTDADTSLGDWLQTISEADRADLRSSAVDSTSAFLELWPPLKEQWRPRSESKVGADLRRRPLPPRGQGRPHHRLRRGQPRRQGADRPQDGRVQPGPSRRSPVLRVDRDDAQRACRHAASAPITSTRASSCPKTSARRRWPPPPTVSSSVCAGGSSCAGRRLRRSRRRAQCVDGARCSPAAMSDGRTSRPSRDPPIAESWPAARPRRLAAGSGGGARR